MRARRDQGVSARFPAEALTQRFAQDALVRTASRAASGELPLNHDRQEAPHAVLLRAACDLLLVHVVDMNFMVAPAIFLTISMVSLQVAHPALKISILCFGFIVLPPFDVARRNALRHASAGGPASYSRSRRR